MDPAVLIQRSIPQHFISALVGIGAKWRIPVIKNRLINAYIKHYRVDLTDSKRKTPEEFEHFVDFFTRELIEERRPLPNSVDTIAAPVDGTVSQVGPINSAQLINAKGANFSLEELILAKGDLFDGGQFVTFYLAPKDYHRIHVPIQARIIKTTEIPGRLFSVNARTETSLDNLFCQNERLVIWLQTQNGPFAMVLVAALIVAGIKTTWTGPVSPYRNLVNRELDDPIQVNRGEEIARFTLGSTVILLLPKPVAKLDNLCIGQFIKMGTGIGTTHRLLEKPAPHEYVPDPKQS